MDPRTSDDAERVARGDDCLPGHSGEDVSAADASFRREVEARKTAILATRMPVSHPVMIGWE